MSAGDPDICAPSPSDVTAGNNKGEGSGGGWKKMTFFFLQLCQPVAEPPLQVSTKFPTAG